MARSDLFQQLISLYNCGKHDDVVARAESMLAADQRSFASNPEAAFIVAASYYQLSRYKEARSLLDPQRPLKTKNLQVLSLYGVVCRRLGDLRSSRAALSVALKLSPDDLSIRNNYANLLIDEGRIEEARTLLNDILLSSPDYVDAKANLARISESPLVTGLEAVPSDQGHGVPPLQADWPELDPLQAAFAEDEINDPSRKRPLEKVLIRAVRRLIAHLPQPEEPALTDEHLQLAVLAIQSNDPEVALDYCNQILLGKPAILSSVYRTAADAYLQLQQFHQAEIALLHSLCTGEADSSVYVNLISFALMRKDHRLARHYLALLDELDPHCTNLRELRAAVESLEAKPLVNLFPLHWYQPSGDMSPVNGR
ncbi:tetratricopeptide repeat protein [Vulcanococcus limneticus]|uniref:tetratricopeptide repeat protein n=1 Tax=Vulcanococcus limneticus TaxID=2170428 RepID=UPI00398BED62